VHSIQQEESSKEECMSEIGSRSVRSQGRSKDHTKTLPAAQ